jgi:hypothetical protein
MKNTSDFIKNRLEKKRDFFQESMALKRAHTLQTFHQVQSTDDILAIVNDVIEERQKVGFSIRDKKEMYNYFGETLTPLYLNFVKDIFKQKFGPITKNVIESFGDTIKTSKEQFPTSYQKQSSTIKEIIEGKLFIHTNMSTNTMKAYIENVAQSLGFIVKHREPEVDELMQQEEEQKKDEDLPF